MGTSFDQVARHLTPYYRDFKVSERLLFTGHSHQAWPDVAREGLLECYQAAARDVDQKWGLAFEKVDILRNYLRTWYDDPDGYYCLAENTHLLIVSWLSSLDLKNKPRLITTTGEFHSMYRQLRRLTEEGVDVVMLDPVPTETFVDRLAEAMNEQTSAVMLSRVFFETGLINPNLSRIAQLCRNDNVPLMIDDYHGTNVVPISLRDAELEDCFLVTGGYKYLQWGEGNCFMRFPKDCQLRPAITGWYASFDTLELPRDDQPTHYDLGDQRFATATYDPASQFRAARVAEFFKAEGLSGKVLRDQYLTQLDYFKTQFESADLDPEKIRLVHQEPLTHNGGFLSFETQDTARLHQALKEHGVLTDFRGSKLRFGVAPYINSAQIDEAINTLSRCIKS